MREQSAAARHFPHQTFPQSLAIDSQKPLIILKGKMLGRRFAHLISRRKMDKSISQIDRRTGIDTGLFGLLPCRARTNFENHHRSHPVGTLYPIAAMRRNGRTAD